MAKDFLQYGVMVEKALRAVVRQALAEVAKNGLPGNHHFYITFRTSYPGVELPAYLKARYPAEMMIVLQFQFYNLEVDETALRVTLTFNNTPERLVIPLAAITVFADPSVNFTLPFQLAEPVPEPQPPPAKAPVIAPAPSPAGDDTEKSGAVVSLDHFRRK